MDNQRGLVYATIKKRRLTVFVVVFLCIMGIVCYKIVPKQEYPIIQLPMVMITTIYPGASASDMEELVSSKIEDECMKATGFDYCTSESYSGVSVVMVMFDINMDTDKLDKSIEDLRNKVNDLKDNDLPDGISSLTFNKDMIETAGMVLAVTGENKSNSELVQRAELLRDELRAIEGVHKVEVDGQIDSEIKITLNTDKLNHLNMSLSEISQIVSAQNSIIPVGTIDFDSDKLTVNSSGKFESLDEIGDIIVNISQDTGAVTKLKDISTIERVEKENDKRYYYNQEPAVLVDLYFDDEANMVDIGKKVTSEIESYELSLPSDIHLDKVIYLPTDVNTSVNDFTVNLVESVIIVLIIVMIGMSMRNGLIVSVAIPLSIFITFIMMKFFKIDIQFISLASLIVALGMLVDNAIVVSDAIQVRFDRGEDKASACVNGAKEVALPVLASTLTTVVIFTIFYMMPGTIKKFVFSLPTIVISALVASYVISMLVTPVMCYFLVKKSNQKKQETLQNSHLRKFFDGALGWAISHKIITLLVAFSLILPSVFLLLSRDLQLLPNSEKNIINIDVDAQNMNDIRKTKEVIDRIENILNDEAPVEYYLSAVGGKIPKYDFSDKPSVDSVNKGSLVLRVNLDKLKEQKFKSKAEYVEYLQSVFNSKVPNSRIVVKELGVIPSKSEPIQIRVSGYNFDDLNSAAVFIENEFKKLDGVKNIYSDRKIKTYDYYVNMKNNLLNSNGLTKAEVQNELNIALMGRESSIYRKDLKEYPITVKSDINEIEDLENLMIKSSITAGKHPLKQVADIVLKEDYASISRYNGKKTVTITAEARDKYSPISLQTQVEKIINKTDMKDLEVTYEGDKDLFFEVIQSLAIGALIGTMGIALILFIQFDSIKQSFIVVLSIPFSLIGASIGLTLFKQTLSLFAVLGLISLIGVVVNNAIVLVDYINGEKANGRAVDDACREAVSRRFRPIMLSTTTTVLGLIPLAISGNVLFRGLSIAFMCGLTTSLIFTLVVIPVVYSAFDGEGKLKRKLRQKIESKIEK